MRTAILPRLEQMMRVKRNHQSPHSKIQIPRRVQTTHTGINQWHTRFSCYPSFMVFFIDFLIQITISFIDRNEFHGAFHFKLLNKMGLPTQTLSKIGYLAFEFSLLMYFPGFGIHFSYRQISPSDIRR